MTRIARIVAIVLVAVPFVVPARRVVAAEDRRAACVADCNERCQGGCAGSGGDCRYWCVEDCPPSPSSPSPSTTVPPPSSPPAPSDADEDAGSTIEDAGSTRDR